MHSVALHTCVSEPNTKICMKIDPYYQQQKCSSWILVSSKVSFMQIFSGSCASGGTDVKGVVLVKYLGVGASIEDRRSRARRGRREGTSSSSSSSSSSSKK